MRVDDPELDLRRVAVPVLERLRVPVLERRRVVDDDLEMASESFSKEELLSDLVDLRLVPVEDDFEEDFEDFADDDEDRRLVEAFFSELLLLLLLLLSCA